MDKPIFRLPEDDRARVASRWVSRQVAVVWSPMRRPEGEDTFTGTLVALARVPGAGYLIVVKHPGMAVCRALPLAQVRSITPLDG